MRDIIKLLRPHQYIKNTFVFIGVIFSGQWDVHLLFSALVSFSSFCVASSAVYVFNDIVDVHADREHPTKRNRPLASGAISLAAARWWAFILAFVSVFLALQLSAASVAIIALYLCINVGYSFWWKHIAILDVFIISFGFLLRIFMGTVGLGIEPSKWLLLCGLMLTLFLGFSKRRAELLTLEQAAISDHKIMRKVLDGYTPKLIDQFLGITAACTIISYSLYTVDSNTVQRFGTETLIYSVPFVVYGIFRYIYLVYHRGHGNDTAKDLLSDAHILFTLLGWSFLIIFVVARTV